MSGFWWGNRVGVVVSVLALLGAVSAILAAAGVKNRWALAVAAGLAALVAGVLAVWQERYKKIAGRRDDQAFAVEDGCLVLPGGRLPAVQDITSPLLLGVHKAQPVTASSAGGGSGWVVGGQVPVYVPRDVDAELRERVAAGGFVLVVGDSTAGKTRAAFEAMAATVPGHLLIRPRGRGGLAAAVARAAQARRCVLWLDDLENYLGAGGLSMTQAGRLLAGTGDHRVIIATLRAAELTRLTAVDLGADDAGRQVLSDVRQVLDLAHEITVPRMFTAGEQDRARTREWDPRIAEALKHASAYGIAEYLAAGPELLRDWDIARESSSGPNARGAALVAAAIDIRRAGYLSPVPRALAEQAHESYLKDPSHARIPREPLEEAWAWATRQRCATTSLLIPDGPDHVEVFDYLVDSVQRRAAAGSYVPEPVVRAAVDTSGPNDADSLAATAYGQGRYVLAEYGWRRAWQARMKDVGIAPGHPSTLASRGNLALVLRDLGRLEEAEVESRAVLDASVRVLGPEHPGTLTIRSNFVTVLRALGRLEEAEAESQAVVQASMRMRGPEHPGTLASRRNLALILRDLGRLVEAEVESRAVLDASVRVLGPEHPGTLVIRGVLAVVLRGLGRLEEAEVESRAVLDASVRVLGPEHPGTLTIRGILATVLRGLRRLEEAETESRAALQARVRVLGPEHPGTLTSRRNLASILHDLERLEEAEVESRAVLDASVRVLGPEHPGTLTSRSILATVLRDLGRLEEAEAESRAALEASVRIRGPEHPGTLAIRRNLILVLRDLGKNLP